ncbi:MAG: phosphopantetheine-binding protein [Eubacteriales bacterium]|nr:phosphopantetheine-binding protein [Eubacteriales bacterium]
MLDKIAAIIEDIFEYDISKVTKDTSFDDDLFADLEDMREVFMAVEEEFGITTEEEDIYSVVTVEDLEIYITMRRAK